MKLQSLKSMLNNIINDKVEEASLDFHSYITERTKQVSGIGIVSEAREPRKMFSGSVQSVMKNKVLQLVAEKMGCNKSDLTQVIGEEFGGSDEELHKQLVKFSRNAKKVSKIGVDVEDEDEGDTKIDVAILMKSDITFAEVTMFEGGGSATSTYIIKKLDKKSF